MACLAALVAGCNDETDPPPPLAAIWAADWATRYTQVRPCRKSIDHDLNFVTIYANAIAVPSYQNRDKPFPDGAVVLKVEYDDEACTTGRGFTAMRREHGYDPNNGDWHWQRADANMIVSHDGKQSAPRAEPPTVIDRCVGCHNYCGVAPEGFDGTCAAIEPR